MMISRRHFLVLAAGAVAGCKTAGLPASNEERTVNAGAVSNYAADGIYNNFRDQGFFVIRKGDNLFALSAICTHRKCKLTAEPDRSFYCHCHGSTFDPGGHVTDGPAKRDLPMLPTFTNELGQLIIKASAT
jgi:Rieske Fe-S protein